MCFIIPNYGHLRYTIFNLQIPWDWFSNLKKKYTHIPLTTLRWRGVTTPLPEFLLIPKDLENIFYIMVLWYIPLYFKGPKKYIYK